MTEFEQPFNYGDRVEVCGSAIPILNGMSARVIGFYESKHGIGTGIKIEFEKLFLSDIPKKFAGVLNPGNLQHCRVQYSLHESLLRQIPKSQDLAHDTLKQLIKEKL